MDYLTSQDSIGLWTNECCNVHEHFETPFGPMFKSYVDWCVVNGEKPQGRKRWTEAMATRGFTTFEPTARRVFLKGLQLIPKDEPQVSSRYGKDD